MTFFETSARTGINVSDAFLTRRRAVRRAPAGAASGPWLVARPVHPEQPPKVDVLPPTAHAPLPTAHAPLPSPRLATDVKERVLAVDEPLGGGVDLGQGQAKRKKGCC